MPRLVMGRARNPISAAVEHCRCARYPHTAVQLSNIVSAKGWGSGLPALPSIPCDDSTMAQVRELCNINPQSIANPLAASRVARRESAGTARAQAAQAAQGAAHRLRGRRLRRRTSARSARANGGQQQVSGGPQHGRAHRQAPARSAQGCAQGGANALSRLRAQARGWSCVRPSPLGAGKMKPCSLCLRPEGRVCPAARAR